MSVLKGRGWIVRGVKVLSKRTSLKLSGVLVVDPRKVRSILITCLVVLVPKENLGRVVMYPGPDV